MILNARNNNFIIKFPRNFLYPKVNDRYASLYKRLPYPFDAPIDFLNASIQQVTMPSVSAENAEQTRTIKTQYSDSERKGSINRPTNQLFDRSLVPSASLGSPFFSNFSSLGR